MLYAHIYAADAFSPPLLPDFYFYFIFSSPPFRCRSIQYNRLYYYNIMINSRYVKQSSTYVICYMHGCGNDNEPTQRRFCRHRGRDRHRCCRRISSLCLKLSLIIITHVLYYNIVSYDVYTRYTVVRRFRECLGILFFIFYITHFTAIKLSAHI